MSTNVINNPSFAGNSLVGWTVSGSIGSYSSQAVFSISNGPTNGELSQVVSVTAGATYNFDFDYGFANAGGATGTVSGAYQILTEPGGTVLASGSFSDSTPINFTSPAADSSLATTFDVPSGVTSVTVVFSDTSSNTVTRDLVLDNVNLAIVCFSAGTLILTDAGERSVETLEVGDLLQTARNGLQPIRWIGKKHVTINQLKQMPNLCPIRIQKSALGDGFPNHDLTVSPQHRMLVSSEIVKRMFGQNEVLVAAKKLIGIPGVDLVDEDIPVDYWHILCDRHEIVLANGAPTETLYLGSEALKALGGAAQEEIAALFPEFALGRVHAPAFQFATGKKCKKLVERHVKNQKPVSCPLF